MLQDTSNQTYSKPINTRGSQMLKRTLFVILLSAALISACGNLTLVDTEPETAAQPTAETAETQEKPGEEVQRTIILSAFAYQNDEGTWLGESGPFLNKLEAWDEVNVIFCDQVVEGRLYELPVSIVTMGVGKNAARGCMDALLFHYEGSKGIKEVIWSGISGFSPRVGGVHSNGTPTVIGDVCISHMAVDWDLQHSSMSNTQPDEWWYMRDRDTRTSVGSKNLAQELWEAEKYVTWPELEGGPRENTLKYHGEAGLRKPKAFHWSECSETTGDNFWHSVQEDARARKLVADLISETLPIETTPTEVIAVTAMENVAWMEAVEEWNETQGEAIPFAYSRSSSNFDHPWLNDSGEPAVGGPESISAGMGSGGSTIGSITASLPILKLLEMRAGLVEEKEPVKVAFVYIGPPGDLGWTYEHDRGRLALEKQLGSLVETTYIEDVPEGPDAARVIRQYAQEGWDAIFTTSFGYMDPTYEVASEFPDVVFEHCSGYMTRENMATYFGRIYQPRYLSGIVAGNATENNTIGYVAAFPIPEVIRGINAFTLGARSVNPDARVHVVWTNTWYDPVIEREAAEALLDEGADLITQHQDTTEPQKAAAERGALSIGYDSDMAKFVGDTVLTSPQWNWGTYYIDTVEAVINGTWETHQFWGGLGSGVVKLADISPQVPEDVIQQVNEARESIMNTEWDVFCGPIKNQDGETAVVEGECMSDEDMLSMSWFVEGVAGEIPE